MQAVRVIFNKELLVSREMSVRISQSKLCEQTLQNAI